MEIRVLPYKPWHYFAIDRRKYDLEAYEATADPEKASKVFCNGPAYTVFINEEILLCMGIMKLWRGVGELWLITSPLVDKYPILTVKICKQYLRDTIRNIGFVRVQAIVRTDYDTGQRWAEMFGFKCEGEMKKYHGGMDFYRYALVRED